MKIVRLSNRSNFRADELGGKGFNLQKLIKWGINVPEAYVVTAQELSKGTISLRGANFPKITTQQYAVRSSGVGEDGNEHSFAGVFDTILEVKHAGLEQAIKQVYSSKESAVTSMYSGARDAKVIDMAIVIQQMVDADYAGVAFSVNPVEQDNRIALIEVVQGLGEGLVSGKVRPTSIRFNKITGMTRVLQNGTDSLAETTLQKIVEEVAKTLLQVEELYGMPIDIEWAFRKNILYLLQARPITTLGDQQ